MFVPTWRNNETVQTDFDTVATVVLLSVEGSRKRPSHGTSIQRRYSKERWALRLICT